MQISIGELQKNISVLKKLKETLFVIDKRTNKKIARIEPINENEDLKILSEIAGSLNSKKTVKNLKEFNKVYVNEISKKYNISD